MPAGAESILCQLAEYSKVSAIITESEEFTRQGGRQGGSICKIVAERLFVLNASNMLNTEFAENERREEQSVQLWMDVVPLSTAFAYFMRRIMGLTRVKYI